MKGLTDPVVGLLMGQTAENLAYRFGITPRADGPASPCAAISAWRPASMPATTARSFRSIGSDGTVYPEDDGLRRDSSMAGLAKLKPFFDKKYGSITPGNSSQITDGAAWLLLASAEAVQQYGLAPLGRIVDSQWAALDPAQMGLGPVHASTPILQRHGLGLNDLDAWEINEAFAAQVLACLAAWKDDAYCRDQLGLDGALGAIDADRLNVDGGAIARRPSGGRERRTHRAASAPRAEAQAAASAASPVDLHRRRSGRRDAGGNHELTSRASRSAGESILPSLASWG